jgi:anti-anti-sigma factor
MFSTLESKGFGVDREEREGVRWLRVSGELDIATVPVLALALSGLDEPPPHVLDLDRLEFMDCTGLRLLMESRRNALEKGASLGVVNTHPIVRRLLEITETRQLLETTP